MPSPSHAENFAIGNLHHIDARVRCEALEVLLRGLSEVPFLEASDRDERDAHVSS